MRTRNIDKLLLKGSPKQRMSLIVEFRAASAYGKKSPITQAENDKLFKSFKSEYEIKLFNKMADQERAIRYYLPSLQNMIFLYQNSFETLKGLSLLWLEYKNEEEVFNQIIYTVKDEPTKEQIRDLLVKRRFRLWTDVILDSEGFVEFTTDRRKKRPKISKDLDAIRRKEEEEVEGSNLEEAIRIVSNRAKEHLSQARAMIEAVRLFMRNTYEIKTYRDMLKDVEAALNTTQPPLPIFNKRYFMGEVNFLGEDKLRDKLNEFKEKNFELKEELLSKFWVYPEFNETPPDEEFLNSEYEESFKPLE